VCSFLARDTSHQSRNSFDLLATAFHMMRLVHLRVLRYLGLGFGSRRHRMGCIIVAVFIFVLILHFLTNRNHDLVSYWCTYAQLGYRSTCEKVNSLYVENVLFSSMVGIKV